MPRAKPSTAPATPISVSGSDQSMSSALQLESLCRLQCAGRKARCGARGWSELESRRQLGLRVENR